MWRGSNALRDQVPGMLTSTAASWGRPYLIWTLSCANSS
jgi:hypothetical protein